MWFILSLFCAFFTATTAAFTKILIKDNDQVFIGWLRHLCCLPIFILIFFFFTPKISLGPSFWKLISIMIPFEMCAFLIYLKSIKISPLSLTFPFMGFTPVFSILTAHLFLNEQISIHAVIGILIVTIGAYLLNINLTKYGVFEPLKSIFREKGPILMIIVAIIYSVTSVLGKKGITFSNTIMFPVIYYPIFFALYTLIIIIRTRIIPVKLNLSKNQVMLLILSAVTFVSGIMLHFSAIALIKAPYMISVKRLSLLFSVIYGGIIFKEENIRYRLLGASVMVAGIAIMVM